LEVQIKITPLILIKTMPNKLIQGIFCFHEYKKQYFHSLTLAPI